jgi:uncharacterized protein
MLTTSDVQNQAETFLSSLFKKMSSHQLELAPQWDIDHLCYRVETSSDYDKYKEAFSKLGHLLAETEVRGRLISTFELHTPIYFQNWMIKLLELPAPKEGKKTKTGFEHIEVVVDSSLEELAQRYPKLDWDRSGLEKIYNSELEISFGSGAVKFHNLSLKSVINFEQRPMIAVLVSELKLLEIFKNNQPFIAGTIPLAIDGPGADVDFLVTFADPKEFIEICKHDFSSLPEFEVYSKEINDLQYSLCRFDYRGVPVELFCSSLSTFKQNAFLHFQVEEKLLKYGPANWTEEVLNLKSLGVKTEPAFAKLLKSDTDGYKLLLDLQKKPISELRSIIRSSLN